MIAPSDRDNESVIGTDKRLTVTVLYDQTMESVFVKPIKEVCCGKYEASFTCSRCGYYMICIFINGCHLPNSPYK